MQMIALEDWTFLIPELLLVFGLVILAPMLKMAPKWLLTSTLLIVISAIIVVLTQSHHQGSFLLGNFRFYMFYRGYAALFLMISLFAFTFQGTWKVFGRTEVLAPYLTLLIGGLLLMKAGTVPMAYLSFELIGFSTFILAGASQQKSAAKSALDYLLTGGFASAMMLFGFALLFTLNNSLDMAQILGTQNLPDEAMTFYYTALSFILTGVAFKLSLIPLHNWVLEVFEHGVDFALFLLSLLPKMAGFYFFWLLYTYADLPPSAQWILLAVLGISLTLSNIGGLASKKPSELLAYSSIAQASFVAMAVFFAAQEALVLAGIYFVLYALGQLAALLLTTAKDGRLAQDFSAFRGQIQGHMWTVLVLLAGLMSLAGLPPLGGFWAKFYYFIQALETPVGSDSFSYSLLAVLILNTVLSFAYYLRIPYLQFFRKKPLEQKNRVNPTFEKNFIASIAAILLLLALLFTEQLRAVMLFMV